MTPAAVLSPTNTISSHAWINVDKSIVKHAFENAGDDQIKQGEELVIITDLADVKSKTGRGH
jgi:hypothetical protein